MIENVITQKELEVVINEFNSNLQLLYTKIEAMEKHLGIKPKEDGTKSDEPAANTAKQ